MDQPPLAGLRAIRIHLTLMDGWFVNKQTMMGETTLGIVNSDRIIYTTASNTLLVIDRSITSGSSEMSRPVVMCVCVCVIHLCETVPPHPTTPVEHVAASSPWARRRLPGRYLPAAAAHAPACVCAWMPCWCRRAPVVSASMRNTDTWSPIQRQHHLMCVVVDRLSMYYYCTRSISTCTTHW